MSNCESKPVYMVENVGYFLKKMCVTKTNRKDMKTR